MADTDIEFYKTRLEQVCKFIAEQLHPDYGPCDGFADGNCSVCTEALGNLKEAHEKVQRYGVPHPVLTEETTYHKGMMVLPQVLCEVVEVDWSDKETRLRLKEYDIGLEFWIDAGQCRHGLPASAIRAPELVERIPNDTGA